MNYQYKVSSHTLNPQLSQFFPHINQPIPYSCYLPSQRVNDFRFDQLNYAKPSRVNDYLSFDSLAEPTKRIRHTQQSFTQNSLNVMDLSHKVQIPQKISLPKHLSTLSSKKDFIERPLAGQPRPCFIPKEDQVNLSFKEDLTVPDLKAFGQNNAKPLHHPYQLMLQKLERQRAEYNLQRQILEQLERNQNQYDHLLKKQFEEKHFNFKQSKPLSFGRQNLEETDASSTAGISQGKIESSEEDGFQYIKIEDGSEAFSEQKSDSSRETKNSTIKARVELKQRTKPNIIKQSLVWNAFSKVRDYPRNKNKWQCKEAPATEGENPSSLNQENQEAHVPTELILKTRKPRQPKPQKPVDIPQHMQDDSTVDYQNLLSFTIIKDATSDEFVMTNKNIINRETRVGSTYQVSVPEYKGPVAGKRRHPKPVWRPEIDKENDLQVYFEQLRSIFSCEMINEEQALRLLKSKKYRREKVRVNIGKSKKFYEKVLVVPTVNEVITDEKTA